MEKSTIQTIPFVEKQSNGQLLTAKTAIADAPWPGETTYEGYTFRRADPLEKGGRRTWRNVKRALMPVASDELVKQVRKQQRGKASVVQRYSGLSALKQGQIDLLIQEKQKEKGNSLAWTIAAIETEERSVSMWTKETVSMQVIVKGEPRKPAQDKSPSSSENALCEKTPALQTERVINMIPKYVGSGGKSTTVTSHALPTNSVKLLQHDHAMEATTGAKASQDVFKQGGRMVVEAEPKGMVGQTKNLGADIVVMPPDPTQAPFIVHQPMHQGAISSNPLHSFNQRRQEEQMYGDLQQQKPSQFSPQHQAPPTAFAPPPPPPPAQTHMPGPHGGLPQQQYYTSRVPVAQHHPTLPQPQTEIHPKQQYYAYQPSRTVLISGQDQYANKENKAARSQGRPGVNEPSKGIGEQEKRQYVAQKPRRNSQNMLQEEKLHRKQKKPKAAHASSYARINDWLEESEYEKENDIFDKTNDSGTDSTTNTSVDTDCISPDLAHRRGSLYRGHRTEPVYKWHQRKAPEDTSSCLSRRDQDIISEILSQLSLRDQLAASSRQESCPRLREHVLAQVRRAALLNKQIFQQPLLTSHHQHPGIFPEVPYASHYLDNERGRSPEKRNMLVRPNISHAYMHVDPRDITGRRRAGVPVQCRPASVGRL